MVEEVPDGRVGSVARMYRVHGPVSTQATIDGTVTWTTKNPAQPVVFVPIRVRGLTPYRAFPGGAGRFDRSERFIFFATGMVRMQSMLHLRKGAVCNI